MKAPVAPAIRNGVSAACLMLAVAFTIIALVSGWSFAADQFRQFWYYLVPLAFGFGLQVGLYHYLKSAIQGKVSPGVVVTTGATSTAAMVSCCAHYLVNILPLLGTAGIITVISQYQIQLFWGGLALNTSGIAYIAHKIYQFSQQK